MKWLRFVVDFMLRFLNRNVKSEEMSRKSFHICVDFDVHAVTCPGVWLCPKGRIELRIAMLGLSVNTRPIAPAFPLLFHEKFRFHKMLRSVNSLTALQGVLKSRNLHIQLLHTTPGHSNRTRAPPSTTVLATFRSPIVDVFYPPSPAAHSLNAGTDVDLLLKPTACFPGIISPKAEISTRVVIEEVVNYCSPERVINPVTVSSKAENTADDVSPLVRQRAVCHSDSCQCCDCYKAKKTSTGQTPFLIGPLPRRPGFRPKQHKRLTKTRNRPAVVENKKYKEEMPHFNCNCEEPADEEEGSTVCKCILCRKYKDYFPSGDYTSSDLDNKPKPKPKKTRCKYCCGDQKEVRRQRKSSSPVKQAEDCCPCMLLNRIPIVEELGEIDNNEFNTLLKNLENHCPNCYQAEPRSITVIKSSLGPIPAGGLSDALAEQRWMGDRVSPGIQGCSCGIYSCRGRKFDESNTKKREESDRLNETNKKSFRDGRKNFYLSLEEYYRQLYARAKQRSSMEIVNTCA